MGHDGSKYYHLKFSRSDAFVDDSLVGELEAFDGDCCQKLPRMGATRHGLALAFSEAQQNYR